MKRWSVLLVLASGAIAWAQSSRPWVPEPFTLPPFASLPTSISCTAGRESRLIAIGNGRSSLGLYVFDFQGQCVAFDDAPGRIVDDRIVSWLPMTTGKYEVQIRNLGGAFNSVEATAK